MYRRHTHARPLFAIKRGPHLACTACLLLHDPDRADAHLQSMPSSATNVLLLLSPTYAASLRAARMLPNLARFRGGSAAGAAALLLATPAAAAGATPFVPLINCVGPASGFFGNVRVPAALLAGASIGQLFGSPDKSRGKWVPKAYTMLIAFTVMAEIFVVFVSTATGTRLLGGGFDPMAADALAFLIREFEGPFVACRVGFFTGLISFISALGLRTWSAFPGSLGWAIACGFAAVVFQMVAFFNFTVLNYRFGLISLIFRFLTIYLTSALNGTSIMSFASLCASMATGVFMVKCLNEKAKDE